MTKLVESFKKDRAKTEKNLSEAIQQRHLGPNEWDIGELFSEAFGYRHFQQFRSQRGEGVVQFLQENASAVTTAAFVNINKQFAYSAVLEAYSVPDFEFSKIIPKIPSGNVKKMVIPGVSNLGDMAKKVNEGQKYPLAGVSENYIETPEVAKYGFAVPITKEAIFFDRTGMVREQCSQVGTWLGFNQEYRAIACVVDAGESETNGQYKYRWGKSTSGLATISTYGDNSGTHNWDNLSASTPLVDYASFETAWALLKAMKDPFTNQPIYINPKHVICGPNLAFKLPFAVGGMITKAVGGYATSGNPARTEIPNPIASIVGSLTPVGTQSSLLETIQNSTTTWYLGDITKAFRYVEAWPLQVDSLGVGSQDEFDADIVLKFKASQNGTYATFEPRAIVKCTA
jgi:hypothetical protein